MNAARRKRIVVLTVAATAGFVLAALAYRARTRGRADVFDARTGARMIDVGKSIHDELVARASSGAARPIGSRPSARDFPAPFPEAVARLFFGELPSARMEFDPHVVCRRRAGDRWRRSMPEHASGGWEITTNDFGLREDQPVASRAFDLRIVVTGDSNIDGVCPNRESFANLTERLLRERDPGRTVDVLNLGTGGTGPVCYPGWDEVCRALDVDVHVAVLYGGNDFMDAAVALRWERRLGPHDHGSRLSFESIKELMVDFPIVAGIQLSQVHYMANNPGDVELGVYGVQAMVLEMRRRAAARGASLLCVYLPPPFTVREQLRPVLAAWGRRHGIDDSVLWCDDAMADAWLGFLDEEGIPRLDLRDGLRSEPEPCYWSEDLHLNLRGHRVVAGELARALETVGVR